jgi:hypothetical protein
MRKARARLALFAVLAVGAVGAVAPTTASALISDYYCTQKPSNQWCDGRANGSFDGLHSWDFNEGWYSGPWDGTVYMCERVWRPATGGVLGSSCGYNYTAHYYGSVSCACYEAEVLQLSSGSRNIQGRANTDY